MSQYKVQIQDGDGNDLMPKTIAEAVTLGDGSTLEDKVGSLSPDTIVNHVTDTTVHVTTSDKTNWNAALTTAKGYTDTQVTGLVNGAPGTLDTLKELEDALASSDNTVDALTQSAAGKSDVTDLTNHTSDTNVHVSATERSDWNAAAADTANLTAEINTLSTGAGTWLPTQTATSGDTTATITSSTIKTTSIVDVYYSTGVSGTEVKADGSITITFDAALTENCDINVRVVNLV